MRQQHEKGQALIIIAAIMVGLIAMLGLAIDGGGIYFLRRDLQNATDAAIVAATYARCSGSTDAQVIEAAFDAAEKNGFIDGEMRGDVETEVTVVLGAAAVPDGVVVSNPDDYVAVSITAGKVKYFIQLVYDGDMDVSARAIGRCNRLYMAENQRAVFASGTCNDGCAISITGADGTVIGGTHSNDGTCGPQSGHATIPPPNSSGDPEDCPPARCLEPAPEPSGQIPMPIVYRSTDFDSSSDLFAATAGANYFKFTGDIDLPNSTVTELKMKNGALIYTTGDVTIKANQLTTYNAYKVTIVSKDGTISIGNGTLADKTFSSYLNQVMGDPQYSLLMFSEKSTSGCNAAAGVIEFSGNNLDGYGMFYAPYGGIKLAGSEILIIGAVWARFVEISSSDSYIEYNPSGVPVSRTTISLPSD